MNHIKGDHFLMATAAVMITILRQIPLIQILALDILKRIECCLKEMVILDMRTSAFLKANINLHHFLLFHVD